MKSIGFYIFAVIIISLSSCKWKSKEKETAAMDTFEEPYVATCRTVIIQPFDGFPEYLSESLYMQIREINPAAELKKSLPLPGGAYDDRYESYRADLLLDNLKKGYDAKKYIVLGVTHADLIRLNEEGLEQSTMGLAAISGHVCVVSSYQLSKNVMDDQLFRLSMHEIGHTEGLQHCKRYRSCYMYRGLRRTNFWGKADFCPGCKLYMVLKGWEM